MNTHGYLNTRGYRHSGYPRGYGAGTDIRFIQRGGDEYHTICTHGYPLTSLGGSCYLNRTSLSFEYLGFDWIT